MCGVGCSFYLVRKFAFDGKCGRLVMLVGAKNSHWWNRQFEEVAVLDGGILSTFEGVKCFLHFCEIFRLLEYIIT
jgi:hypothetical protein